MTKKYDVIVIGAGPGGLTAGLYASRSNLSVLILDRGIYGGQMNNTGDIENYPGFELISGPDLSEKMYASATKFGAEYAYGNVKNVTDHGEYKLVETDEGDFEGKTVIIATGAEHKHLGVPGEEDLSGMGVSYCAVCDAAFFKNREVVVVGGGDSAVEEGLYLTQLASKVTIIHRRDQLRAQQILQQRAFANPKIEFVWNAITEEIVGTENKTTGVKYRDKNTGEEHVVPADGVFIYVGIMPMTDKFKELNITDENGWIITDEKMRTSVPGIFAIGDVRANQLRQIATAVGDGGIAGQGVYEYLQETNSLTQTA
ncbi:thioredoxin reductase [Amylolactobacillus amylotrophicus DSM 20534]|uniref:Thioredoxin reductase n=3 Tax=Amylolactobacillus TaxID=2767876 RepID=A0A0R1YTS9_9LACO|nr:MULTISPECIES: thioredoxin-disulfide reductase [Amylolactobacillus]APT18955.1 thioredoxin-disulfide reductase [Amylolactobacillus amylophilus DSM 20533 = JCM 1125]KRK38785.1 thioredoxin reductase [Amylolactobacillus amylotrophicus DSM 20534]KRM42572.1 thioredoxin reductase [Amylolactobacillus amylophilus DSM 20533 = JCM 1125]GED80006.1 thioredoxin reductase [Amylolactobacillus amylophilus]